jgi:hypothetical protein
MGRGPHGSRRRKRLLTMRVVGKPGAAVLMCPTGKSVTCLSSPFRKNIPLLILPKSNLYPSPSRPTEGRLAIVTDAGRDAVDVGGAKDESAGSRTAKSCGPDAPTLASSSR